LGSIPKYRKYCVELINSVLAERLALGTKALRLGKWARRDRYAQLDKALEVLVDYLIRYFEQRTLNARGRGQLRITLVDGFCGGGLYTLKGKGTEVLGSHFAC
jgi:hypothetical protein